MGAVVGRLPDAIGGGRAVAGDVHPVAVDWFGYDDNLFARTVGTGDQMTLLTPAIEASYSNPRAAFLGLYTFDMQRSFDHPALNELDARRHAFIDATIAVRRSCRSRSGTVQLHPDRRRPEFNTGLLT